jgi:2-phosphosulfolactate phosphatase
MEIKILHLIEGAKQAEGLTVIIDVFRAFSVACYVFANDAEKILTVGDLETAYNLKKTNPGYILIGEREYKKPEGFDHGNSPAQIEKVDFTGKTVVQTTSAGTQGIANAKGADEIITGSFVNALAIIKHIKARDPKIVSLVCMGVAGKERSDEDTLCAEFIADGIIGKSKDFRSIRDHLFEYESAKKFFDPEQDWAPQKDFDLCLDLDRFDFILKAQPVEDDIFLLKKTGL